MATEFDVIGPIYHAGTARPTDGWHVNTTPDTVAAFPVLTAFTIAPRTLQRVWAGDDPAAPSYTVPLRFEDERDWLWLAAEHHWLPRFESQLSWLMGDTAKPLADLDQSLQAKRHVALVWLDALELELETNASSEEGRNELSSAETHDQLQELRLAVIAMRKEIEATNPSIEGIRAPLKRLETIRRWLASKADIAATEAAKKVGQIAAGAVVVGVLAIVPPVAKTATAVVMTSLDFLAAYSAHLQTAANS